jgi:uroporphyrinogen decarboxylase
MFHSDGAIRDFLPDMIADGVQVLDPVQTSAAGMEISGLKEDFGHQLVFHGALDTQWLLPFGSPQKVKDETIRTMRVLGERGGLILGPSHNVQPDVPPENLLAMCQAVKEAGSYPL